MPWADTCLLKLVAFTSKNSETEMRGMDFMPGMPSNSRLKILPAPCLPKQHSGESPNDGYGKQSSQHFGLAGTEPGLVTTTLLGSMPTRANQPA